MLPVTDIAEPGATPSATLTLPFELRQKSRQRTRLDDGTEVGIALARGTVLRSGDRLRAADDRVIEVRAAEESVSTARSADAVAFARACYHLGNRHLPLQIGEGWLRYLHDHVLDDMVRGLGLEVVHEHAPFEPEGGAYGGHGHSDGGRRQHHHHGGHDHARE